MSDTICTLPWVSITVETNGDIRPCCVSKDFVKKSDGTHYNLGYDDITEIINSPDLVQLRQDMLDGKKPEGCTRCWTQEQFQGRSNRMTHNHVWKDSPEFIKKLQQGTIIDPTAEYFHLRFGNLCNLNCKSCNAINSSQLEKELKELEPKGISKFYEVESYDTINDWYQTDKLMENLTSQLNNIQTIYMTGGEPTIIEKNFEILNLLVEKNLSNKIKLVINTNMTNVNSKFYDLLKKFNEVVIWASIDGYKEIQEYIRYPSNWNQIDKNVRKVIEFAKFRPCPVIQITNLNNIVDLFEYLESFNREAGKAIVHISPIILDFPSRLNLVNLPLEYKKECWERIDDWIKNKCEYQLPFFHKRMNAVKNKCLVPVEYTQDLKDFFESNDIFDEHRNFYLSDVNPELYALRNKLQ